MICRILNRMSRFEVNNCLVIKANILEMGVYYAHGRGPLKTSLDQKTATTGTDASSQVAEIPATLPEWMEGREHCSHANPHV